MNDPNRMEIRMLSDNDIELGPDSSKLETLESLVEECLGASFKSLTATDSNGRTLLHRLVNRIKDDIQVRFAFDQSKSLKFYFIFHSIPNFQDDYNYLRPYINR